MLYGNLVAVFLSKADKNMQLTWGKREFMICVTAITSSIQLSKQRNAFLSYKNCLISVTVFSRLGKFLLFSCKFPFEHENYLDELV